jgi:hypothetical protein
MVTRIWSFGIRRLAVAALVVSSASCGELTRQGTSPAYLIINALEGAKGNESGTFSTNLISDVVTVVDGVPTIFNDLGRVSFALGLKDPGPATGPTTPSQNNFVTVERYHVQFIRADGRNTQGVDVPYAFDGAFTVTVSANTEAGFVLVRNQAKQEAPLAALGLNGTLISTIAEVTFYGHDQTGRTVTAVGRIDVTFGNFADPKN